MTARSVLVIGSGGREYALCLALEKSPSVGRILVAPGNDGMQERWTCHQVDPLDSASIVTLAHRENVDLTVVGPEAPLVGGLVDALRDAGVVTYGPTRGAAQLEGSKAYMKRFAERHGIPTAPFRIFTSPSEARAYISGLAAVPVVKADGLCAGKGVTVSEDMSGALKAVDALLEQRVFGQAGETIIVEERLVGQELSVLAMCDGTNLLVLPNAQDYKRLLDSDRGPNTGGMGAYAPALMVGNQLAQRIRQRILAPAIRGLRQQGDPMRGTLYAGLMITPEGDPYLLEFNVRFGDPELQVVAPLLDGDFGEACYQAAAGRLEAGVLRENGRHALCVVLAADGYPGGGKGGSAVFGVEEAERTRGVTVIPAGTRKTACGPVSGNGRVLNVIGEGRTLREARSVAYQACGKIRFEGMHYRHDIGGRAVGLVPRERIESE